MLPLKPFLSLETEKNLNCVTSDADPEPDPDPDPKDLYGLFLGLPFLNDG